MWWWCKPIIRHNSNSTLVGVELTWSGDGVEMELGVELELGNTESGASYQSPGEVKGKKLTKVLTMEAKTVKTNKRTKSGQKGLKIPILCDYFESLEVRLGMDF